MSYLHSHAADTEAILRLHELAFGQDDEAVLVRNLLADPSAQPSLSLVAVDLGQLVGHALFTALTLDAAAVTSDLAAPLATCAILAPLAVLPSRQRAGIGRGLIDAGCRILAQRGVDLVFVLGDPGYYGGAGFQAATPHGLHAPYTIEPAAAWMVRALRQGVLGRVQGSLRCAQSLAPEPYWRE